MPDFDGQSKQLDDWYFQVFKIMDAKAGEIPEQFSKFVKIVLSSVHHNAFLECGFNTTKHISTGRETLSLRSVKGQKICIDVIDKFGGTD